jgi:hypothetical protein
MSSAFVDYFRCRGDLAAFETTGEVSAESGFFTFDGMTCYGRPAGVTPASTINGALPNVSHLVSSGRRGLQLPFDLSDVVTNHRWERYAGNHQHSLERLTSASFPRKVYYFLRPALSVGVRRHLQKIRLSGWEEIPFPRWPVDATVDALMRRVMALVSRRRGGQRMPFIWFWPDGAAGCALMTHDVEGPVGEQFCGQLMDLDRSFGIRSAFQVVPQVRSGDSLALMREVRRRGFEANLHDLNHDGSLFADRQQFLERAELINRYAREYECGGFRSGAMYREQRWFGAFDFSYDMSVPNVAHLEPQRGGCCTVMPYFVGEVLELPSTTIQDYSLFHILREYSIERWREQCELILANNGLITFITHPDYLVEPRAQGVYCDLLGYLNELRDQRGLWITLPAEVDRWWRNRARMRLVADGDSWRIEGPDSARACVAYATLDGDRVVYEIDRIGTSPRYAARA